VALLAVTLSACSFYAALQEHGPTSRGADGHLDCPTMLAPIIDIVFAVGATGFGLALIPNGSSSGTVVVAFGVIEAVSAVFGHARRSRCRSLDAETRERFAEFTRQISARAAAGDCDGVAAADARAREIDPALRDDIFTRDNAIATCLGLAVIEENRAAEGERRACIERRTEAQRRALAIADLQERGRALRAMPSCVQPLPQLHHVDPEVARKVQARRHATARDLALQGETAAANADCATAISLGEKIRALDEATFTGEYTRDAGVAACLKAASGSASTQQPEP
jgi:hypothetical protein